MDMTDPTGGRATGRCRITLNGTPHELADATTIARLLEDQGMAGGRVAVEVNQAIVPRGEHDRHELRDGDRVEIVHALGGG
jgi:sulfur carrier protein